MKPALDAFWALVRNWKQGKSSELKLVTENGHMKVNFSMDLGAWVPPTPGPPRNPPAVGPQAPKRGPGPCRQRRRERRAAERASEKATEEVAEEVIAENLDVSSGKSTEKVASKDTIDIHDEAEEAQVKPKEADEIPVVRARTCTICGQSTRGHPGPCGKQCTNVQSSPEVVRSTMEDCENL